VAQIRETIDALVERVQQRPRDTRAFRMNIERVFAVKGYGTVVSGIPVSGEIGVGQQVELLPPGQSLTVRTIQSYKLEADRAFANCCTAINLRDIEPQRVARGMTLATPGVFQSTRELIATLCNRGEQPLKRRFEARLHAGTTVVDANIKFLECEFLERGGEALAHLVLAEPLVAAAGDRFILRHPAANTTLGGGTVLSAAAQTFRRRTPLAPRFAQARAAMAEGDFLLAALLAGPAAILKSSELLRLTQYPPADAQRHIDRLVSNRHVIALGGKAWAIASRADELAGPLRKSLETYHRRNPYSWGMSPTHVCQLLELDAHGFAALAQWLGGTGQLALKHGRLALASFKPNISERMLQLRQKTLDRITQGGVLGPARGNLMDELSISEPDMQALTKLLLEDGSVVALDGNFVLREIFETCRQKLLTLFQNAQVVEMNAFRDAIGANRKMAVAMLDAFDGEGLTRRVPAGRVLVHHESASPVSSKPKGATP
jgi:selenocysteine-specific elongation factor